MKVKIIQGTELQRLENLINDFIEEVKFESIDLKTADNKYIFIICYYDKI